MRCYYYRYRKAKTMSRDWSMMNGFVRYRGEAVFFKNVFAAAGVKLSKTKFTLNAGYTKQLKVSGAKEKAVRWITSARTVASVSENGLVRGEGQGSAKIYAKVGKKKLVCKVTVKDPAVAVKNRLKRKRTSE